ncbi:hypothetical protein PRIPAC_92624 [Pristionchus pacificus]|uniref:Uncharacterized protein n=1 Tax=Pristionchus pacificus TaxID=54126 RepID=A0A2A6BQS2_PRIPA|nr:hypothetical protein PRIPAC_92624 [Pristionchus pacificus]|eukprot:PDM68270.1 hypothetical protein PRIPAC_46314 [Pristionchus pacificus]
MVHETENNYRMLSSVPSRPFSFRFFTYILISVTLSVILYLTILEWIRDENSNPTASCNNLTTCTGENMQFIRYDKSKALCRGLPFSCELKTFIDEWKISDAYSNKIKPINVWFLYT